MPLWRCCERNRERDECDGGEDGGHAEEPDVRSAELR
jgi:hypothetical protein